MFRETVRTLLRAVRRTGCALLGVRLEAGRNVASERTGPITETGLIPHPNAGASTGDGGNTRIAPQRTATRPSRDSVSGIDRAGRRSFIAVEAPSPESGLVAARDRGRFTLAAIRKGMKEIESRGYKPNGIVMRDDEIRIVLKQNFDWDGDDRDPLPDKIELFGLPVKVQD